MKALIGPVLFLAFGTAMWCGGASTNGSPTTQQDIEIVWNAPTNDWPDKLWSYKVVPQEFSETVVSNLMALGPFTMSDRIPAPASRAEVDRKAMSFGILGLKDLHIMPTLGYIEYHDRYAIARAISPIKDVPEPVVGVPSSDEETTRLGLKYLRLAGIDVSQLGIKPGPATWISIGEKERGRGLIKKQKRR